MPGTVRANNDAAWGLARAEAMTAPNYSPTADRCWTNAVGEFRCAYDQPDGSCIRSCRSLKTAG